MHVCSEKTLQQINFLQKFTSIPMLEADLQNDSVIIGMPQDDLSRICKAIIEEGTNQRMD